MIQMIKFMKNAFFVVNNFLFLMILVQSKFQQLLNQSIEKMDKTLLSCDLKLL
jgi:hypothetical protein